MYDTPTPTITVGVLMGGRSIEREVSLNSGRTVCDHLDTTRYAIKPLFQTAQGKLFILPWHFLHRGKTTDFEHRLKNEAEEVSWDDLKSLVDFIYIALHGRYAEDGTLQGFLEVLKIPYLGSKVFSSALGMHKALQKEFLKNIPSLKIPRYCTVTPEEIELAQKDKKFLEQKLKEVYLEFPVIVKPLQEGSSLGIKKIALLSELLPAIQAASNINRAGQQTVIIEEYLTGMEFSCIVITDYKTGALIPLPPTEIVIESATDIFDYDQKYMPGRATKRTPAHCTQEEIKAIQRASVDVMQALGFSNLARIDGFLCNGLVYITDPNSFSGMSPSSYAFLQAAEIGMNHTNLINHLIETELHHYGMLATVLHAEKKQKKTMQKNKKRVAVILGGASNEREISLESGRNISYKLSPQKYTTSTLFLNTDLELYRIPAKLLVRNTTKEIAESLTPAMKIAWSDLPHHFDFIFLGLHGGAGENGSVQGALEMLNMPYNGSSVLASALCMDKFKTNQLLSSKNFSVPKNHVITHKEWQQGDQKNIPLSFPVIIKPCDDGCSVMVTKATNQAELESALSQIFQHDKERALVEEFIGGTELTVGVIGNEKPFALPPSQTVTAKNILSIEEKFLPGAGENLTPAPLPKPVLALVQKTVEQVYQAVECSGYARIDCFYQTAAQSPTGQERVVIIEVNTLPGMTPATCLFHQAAEVGIKPMDFIDLIVQLGFEKHTQKPHLSSQQKKFLENRL